MTLNKKQLSDYQQAEDAKYQLMIDRMATIEKMLLAASNNMGNSGKKFDMC